MRERRDSNPQPPTDKTTPRTPRRFVRGALCQLSYTPPPQHCAASNGVLTGRLGVSSMLLPFVTYATRLLAEALGCRSLYIYIISHRLLVLDISCDDAVASSDSLTAVGGTGSI
jgi:hypothetical protein